MLHLYWYVASVLCCFACAYETEELFTPNDCEKIAQPGDHLLIEYFVVLQNQTVYASIARPNAYHHVLLDFSDEVPVHAVLKGMCLNASKSLMWEQAADVQLEPILPFYLQNKLQEISDQSVSVRLTVMHITSPESFQIFEPLKEGNITRVFELVDARIGADAVDEEGETPLLIAVNQNMNFVISHLLNARMPRPDVNFAKASGFTALFYAINSPSEFLTNVLLRRGADPNAAVIQAGSRGNTPLHFACLQQKQKHAQLLLQYGANPYAVNEYGVQPFELLPQDASRQTKQFFKKIFEDAAEAKANAIEADYHETRKEDQEL